MPLFKIEATEARRFVYTVEAENEEEAREIVFLDDHTPEEAATIFENYNAGGEVDERILYVTEAPEGVLYVYSKPVPEEPEPTTEHPSARMLDK